MLFCCNFVILNFFLEGSVKLVTINEDGLDCLSNDEVEKQCPIHIAYKSSHIMTLVEGVDGVARLITRDLMGNFISIFILFLLLRILISSIII